MKLLDTPMGTTPTGRRPWLRWLALAVFVVALAIAFVNLGRWQLDRLEQRREMNGSVISHENTPVADFATIFTRTIVDADQWQRVTVRGTFDPDRQFMVRYRSLGPASGYEVLTPLRTTTGAWVLVDRGFGTKPNDEDYPSTLPAPPAGEVDILGYVRRDEQGSTEAITPVAPSNTVRLINSTAVAGTLPYPLVNGFVSVIQITPAQAGALTPVTPPELTEGNHFSYALQWFAFAGMAGLGLVLLIRSDVRAMRRAAKAPATGSEEAP